MLEQEFRLRFHSEASPSIQSKSQKLQEIILDDDWPTLFDNDEQQDCKQKRKKLWRKFFNVYHSMKFFQRPKIQTISNQFELMHSLEETQNQTTQTIIPLGSKSQNLDRVKKLAVLNADKDVKQAFQEIQNRSKFFQLIQNPSLNQFDQMKKILNQDCRKYIYPSDHPLRLINQKNQDGLTPLYFACLNGYQPVVQFLLDNGANPNIIIEQHGIKTTPLAAAIRWQFYNIAEMILATSKLNKAVLELSLKECNYIKKVPKKIQDTIQNQLRT